MDKSGRAELKLDSRIGAGAVADDLLASPLLGETVAARSAGVRAELLLDSATDANA